MNPTAAPVIVILSPDELRSLVQAAVREELAKVHGHDVDVLDLDDVAALLRICKKTVVKYIEKKGLPATSFGRDWRFRRRDILQWLQEQAVRPGASAERYAVKLLAVKGDE